MRQNFINKIAQDKQWLTLLALALFVLLLRWPSLDLPFSNDGGANAYHARLITQGEPLYSTHHTGHHLPAVYYTYALAFYLFGDHTWSVKLMVLIWVLGTVYVIYQLGILLLNKNMGLLAAIFYAVLSAQLFLKGPSGETELFANLPRTAAILILLQVMLAHPVTVHQKRLWWRFVLFGALNALAIMFKGIYVSPLMVAACILLIQLWQNRNTGGVWRTTIIRSLWIGLGFLAVLLAVVAYFAWLGLLSRFGLIFTFGPKYVNVRNSVPEPIYVTLLFPVFALIRTNALIYVLSLMAAIILLLNRKVRTAGMLYLVLWYLFSFGETVVTRVFLGHYYLLILPSLSILAAWMLIKLYRDLETTRSTRWSLATGVLGFVLVASFALSIWSDSDYYTSYIRYKLGWGTYEEFLLSGEPLTGPYTIKAEKLAAYLQMRTKPDEYIYYWSDNMQFYYFVNRRAPIDIIWPFYAGATGSHDRIFTPQTKYIVLGEIWIGGADATPEWMYEGVAKSYTLETIIDGEKVYRRVD
jgi:4-amino-4-deoxy-L-arabinose transferase-like glycosyltransferase